ncbi:lysozyme [Rahnella sp. CJA17(1/100)]|uniref:lysozyme n=1 Tax=Rahnella sp. CJA17(1/100) TaxID=2508951 RepID=UPI00106FEA37|nr:lysozyme [Rahnella sp. CJA17(1/100)]
MRESMSVSQNGLGLIEKFEGLRLNEYRDQANRLTIGYGHLILPNEAFPHGITQAKAIALLRNDVGISEKGVNKLVTVELTQNQFDALVSFTYNLGVGSLESSHLLKYLNEGQFQQAAGEFLNWDKVGDLPDHGLLVRREAERDLFMDSDSPATGIICKLWNWFKGVST